MIPQTAPGTGSPEKNPEEALPAEQREEDCTSALRPPAGGRPLRSTSLADLLFAAAALVAKIKMEEPDGEAAAREILGIQQLTTAELPVTPSESHPTWRERPTSASSPLPSSVREGPHPLGQLQVVPGAPGKNLPLSRLRAQRQEAIPKLRIK
ncbi:unnamed protein product [Lampetra fluviatilis]